MTTSKFEQNANQRHETANSEWRQNDLVYKKITISENLLWNLKVTKNAMKNLKISKIYSHYYLGFSLHCINAFETKEKVAKEKIGLEVYIRLL